MATERQQKPETEQWFDNWGDGPFTKENQTGQRC